ncbi:uncharacterized protein EKO05_0007684 [Ascochyta rabiei]|uniref:Protein disulfide oxidoreductase n=1 Tax=Didymella rabiei TaxID=5454 RepID=A0A162VJ66_DIDRA|nr:uncharacterized protein EKO05_0007684 [Ascochyta rabiei]KZM18490.1 protein disulfide oxidoreductase [Ascochyta rabiei]UPX17320.1 hypothetical protein EKO05_0007684 [Ascochyta rabiei]
MGYDSTITFTLDTICPWTYLGFLRLQKALAQYRDSNSSSTVTFQLQIAPYQLHPKFSQEGIDRHTWYRDEKYQGSEDKFNLYCDYMGALGKDEGVVFDFGEGPFANTFHAHRILQYVQERLGPEAAVKGLESLYQQYFCERAHPSGHDTLITACRAAGLSEHEGRRVVEDESEAAMETKMAIQEQAGNGVDSVPYIVFEGRRRDFTLIGAKDVNEYVKMLEQVAKEAS